jgi:hypothetical protein
VNRVRVTSSRRPRVYTFWSTCIAVALAALAAGASASAQSGPETGADPAMIKGAANAPIVIVEFSDYQ